jgi:hypothetical protein
MRVLRIRTRAPRAGTHTHTRTHTPSHCRSRGARSNPILADGGESFELPLPGRFVAPRVSAAYGSGVEEVLSLSPIQALADAAPGLIKVALRPPSSVDAVATACALAAMGELASGAATRRAVGTLDGTAAIKAAAGEPTPTGLRQALNRLGDKIADFTEKFFDAIQARLEKR